MPSEKVLQSKQAKVENLTELLKNAAACVLVDYKNLSRATSAVIDPESDEYIGHYIPQQKAYKDALERAGFKVKACLLHLSLQA